MKLQFSTALLIGVVMIPAATAVAQTTQTTEEKCSPVFSESNSNEVNIGECNNTTVHVYNGDVYNSAPTSGSQPSRESNAQRQQTRRASPQATNGSTISGDYNIDTDTGWGW